MATQTNKDQFLGGLAKVLEEQWQVDASRSEVLKKMLESDEVKNSANQVETITLSELNTDELEALVEFIYSDGSTLSAKVKQHVRSLYFLADKYVILHLRDLCRSELISSLNPENALDFLELAQIPFDKVLHDAAFSFIKMNINTIASSEKFKVFVVSNPNLALEIMKASLTSKGNGYCSRCGSYKLYCRSCGH
ncbi:hypothetical protein EUTSA_v10017689mg [Eutrema salsugineum]|uniref:BTB domain-containing protein n=1 Tax=Eutrema salsugineum TaxID=72664 RepID=V4MJG1_EUTSA|nr:hypothetical protein EUTSA_v10017689mg [Eutrema salsugineum]